MTGWTGEELETTGSSDELQIASIGPDGTKYRRYSPGIAASVLTPQARSATIRLIPRPTTS
jgi:hypothetical protein